MQELLTQQSAVSEKLLK